MGLHIRDGLQCCRRGRASRDDWGDCGRTLKRAVKPRARFMSQGLPLASRRAVLRRGAPGFRRLGAAHSGRRKLQVRGPCLAAVGPGVPSSRPTLDDSIGPCASRGVSTLQQSYGDGGIAPSGDGGAEMGSRPPYGRQAQPQAPLRTPLCVASGRTLGRRHGALRGRRPLRCRETHRVGSPMVEHYTRPQASALCSAPCLPPHAKTTRSNVLLLPLPGLPCRKALFESGAWCVPPRGFMHSSACPRFRGPLRAEALFLAGLRCSRTHSNPSSHTRALHKGVISLAPLFAQQNYSVSDARRRRP
jgi:hypothetical protein